MGSLQVSLFGNIKIAIRPEPGEIFLTRSSQELFGYLLLARNRMHPRSVLAGLFWADATEEHARGCLNTSLWRLRQSLEPPGTQPGTFLIINQLNEVGFNAVSDYWLDVEEFETCIHPLLVRPVEQMSSAEAQALEHSLNLYRGDLLEGIYEDWALRERERLRFLYLSGLAFLMRFYQNQQSIEKSLVYGQRILALDPLREEIHREMIRMYMQNGRRALAVRQYEFCRHALAAELDILPMEETQALYQQIISRQARPNVRTHTDRQTLNQLIAEIENTQRSISSAELQLKQLIEAIRELIP